MIWRFLQKVWAECREIIGIIKYSQTSNLEVYLPFLGLMSQEKKTGTNEKGKDVIVERATSQEL